MDNQLPELKDRIISIDILRGLSMFMILSTQIGGAPIWTTLNNVLWGSEKTWPHFVFNQMSWSNEHVNFMNSAQSFFLFVVGVVIPFSMKNRLLKNNKSQIYLSIIKRSAILFLFGLIAGGKLLNLPEYNRTLATIPVYNNGLEPIAVSYLVCSVIVLNTKIRTQFIITIALLLLYWFVWFIPAPGGNGDIFSKDMNIGIYIERLVLGDHTSHFGSWTGIFNTVSHIMLAMIGVLCGHLIFGNREKMEKFKLLLVAGISMIVVGKIWGLAFPVMRSFMTSTFVLISGGIGVLLLAAFYYIIDIRGYSRWSFFFYVFGVNSIAIYMMAHLFDFRLIGNIVAGGFSARFSSGIQALIQAVCAMAVMWLIMLYMYRKKTFLKV
jgi:predicted acyltransferase